MSPNILTVSFPIVTSALGYGMYKGNLPCAIALWVAQGLAAAYVRVATHHYPTVLLDAFLIVFIGVLGTASLQKGTKPVATPDAPRSS
ncbi:MAG TPA: hypothetical protein VFV19_06965 [Candidatus Polarisedimenticolaceae bacterium]|nr:hypothetical protein [Candidatus Polarisedimenticolaceae bacterium]